MNGNIHLSIATSDYDHVREFRLGSVRAEGIDTTWLLKKQNSAAWRE